jgi:hypothetical protein
MSSPGGDWARGFSRFQRLCGKLDTTTKPCGQPKVRTITVKRTVRSIATVIGAWLIATFSIRVVPVVFLGALPSKMPFDMVSVFAVAVVFV